MKFKLNRFLPYSRQEIDDNDILSVKKVLKSDFITQGPEIINFEKNFAKYTGAKYAVSCATGTAALHLSCLALGINQKHNILTSPITFVASANCGEFVGAKTHFADIDFDNYCLSPKHLEIKLKKKKIDLVIVVHMCGHSAEMREIYKLKKKYKFFLIEDACHALGGKYNNKKVGSCYYSDISTFSFHPVKPITTGEGGMITTNNKNIYEKLLIYRTHGIHKNSKKFLNKDMAFDNNGDPNRWFYEMTNLGYNYRITDLQASLGNSQLKKLDRFTVKRNKIAKMYNFGLKSNKFIKTPDLRKDVKHAYHLYTILIDFKSINKSRNQLMKELGEVKIGTQVLYIPVFLQPYYRKKYNYKKTDFKNSIKYYEQALSIPIFNSLRKSEIFYVINKLNQIIKK
jgi:UDP-4-amino-4,6-dideoxy-N-acetyl-beta-L-altrosamine transaminase